MSTLKEKIKALINNRIALGVVILIVVSFIAGGLVYITTKPNKPDVNINVAQPGDVCYLQFSVEGTQPVEGFSCNKEFRDLNNNPLASNYKPKPLEKFIMATKIVNTGNTNITSLTLEDPLNNDLSSQGAKNLEYVTYELLKTSAGTCTFDSNTKLFKCTGINLNTGETLEATFQVSLASNVGSAREITNVSKVYNSNSTVYCSATVTSSPISNICNYTSGYCEQVFRDKETNETSCATDNDCKTSTPKHLECVQEACKVVEGAGSDKCSTDNDCKEEVTETHLICKDKQCKEVKGSGKSECSKDSDCVYKRCVNNSCTLDTCEDGDCKDECDTSADCRPSVTPGTPKPVVSVTPAVPQTGSSDQNLLVGLFILAWVGSGAFFAAKAGLFTIRK